MQTIINQNTNHKLIVEKVKTDFWLELIEHETGLSRILIHKRGFGHSIKSITKAYKNMLLADVQALMDKIGVKAVKMYKPRRCAIDPLEICPITHERIH